MSFEELKHTGSNNTVTARRCRWKSFDQRQVRGSLAFMCARR